MDRDATWADEHSNGNANSSNAKNEKDPPCNQQSPSLFGIEDIIWSCVKSINQGVIFIF